MMMEDYIRKAQAAGASDLHLTSGLGAPLPDQRSNHRQR